MEDYMHFDYELGDPADNADFEPNRPGIKHVMLIEHDQMVLGYSHHGVAYYLCREEIAMMNPPLIAYAYVNMPLPEGAVVRWMDGYKNSRRIEVEEQFIAQALDE